MSSEIDRSVILKDKVDILKYRSNLVRGGIPDSAIEDIVRNYENLLTALNQIDENILLISVGGQSMSMPEQQIPSYLKKIAETEKVRIIVIDGLLDEKRVSTIAGKHPIEKQHAENRVQYTLKDNPNLTIEFFGCYIFPEEDDRIRTEMTKTIDRVLDRGGRVFVANHTQAYSFQDIPGVADLCNAIKQEHPHASLLQLYTQGGYGQVRYYQDNIIDYSSDGLGQVDNGTFKTCPKLQDLQFIEEFTPDYQPSTKLRMS